MLISTESFPLLPKKRKHSEIVAWSATMMPKIYNPPADGICRSVCLDDASHIGLVIGKNGSVFNAITHQTPGVMYIWYNKNTRSIEVWGDSVSGINQAIEKIWQRVNYVDSLRKFDNVHTNLLYME